MIKDTEAIFEKKVFPAVSIILSIHPQFPEIKTDSANLVAVLKNIEKQLHEKYGNEKSEMMLQKVKAAVSKIPTHHLLKSILIYVSPDIEKIVSLPFTVTEKVMVGDSFEIRDILYAIQKNKCYLVVLISQNHVKTFVGDIFRLAAIEFAGMPENVHEAWNEHSFPGWDYIDTKSFDEKNIRNYLRFIDETLENALKQNNYPVVVMGDIKLLGYFRQHTRNSKRITGYVEGNYDHAVTAEIKKKAEPVMDKFLKQEEEKSLVLLQGAVSKNNYSAGITEVWRAAAEGKGRLLLVEKDYRQRARRGDNEYEIIPDLSDINPHNILNDAVDDVIELVLKNNGEVMFVENDSLKAYNHIALITRF